MQEPSSDGDIISDLVTVILTTSPTPSAPSTELVSAVLQSFESHCSPLLNCRMIIVFDTYDSIVSRAKLKKGQVTAEQAHSFELYKDNVKQLFLQETGREGSETALSLDHAEYGSPVKSASVVLNVTHIEGNKLIFIEPAARLGFGLAVRSALRMVKTPYVWVQQHDWPLAADIPLASIVRVMRDSNEQLPVEYVGFLSIRMLDYVTSMHAHKFPELRRLTQTLRRDFIPGDDVEPRIPLTPVFFWYDKPHVASTSHYLSRIFPSSLALRRGDFIEDHIGQRARNQMKEGLWARWASWLYYPEDGKKLCLRHLEGRTWRGEQAEQRQIAMYKERAVEKISSKDTTEEKALNEDSEMALNTALLGLA